VREGRGRDGNRLVYYAFLHSLKSRDKSPTVYVHTSTQNTEQTRNIAYSLWVTNPSRNGNVQIPGKTATNQYYIHEETKSRLNSRNVYLLFPSAAQKHTV
jgi:hypothetical protein